MTKICKEQDFNKSNDIRGVQGHCRGVSLMIGAFFIPHYDQQFLRHCDRALPGERRGNLRVGWSGAMEGFEVT